MAKLKHFQGYGCVDTKLVTNEIESGEDVKDFLLNDAWDVDDILNLNDAHIDELCDAVYEMISENDFITNTQLNDILSDNVGINQITDIDTGDIIYLTTNSTDTITPTTNSTDTINKYLHYCHVNNLKSSNYNALCAFLGSIKL